MKKEEIGLTDEEVLCSRERYGNNTLTKEKSKGFWRRFFENLNDPIIKVLIIALIVEVVFTLGKCNLFEVFGIVVAIIIATTVSTVSEYGSEKAFLKMQAESLEGTVRVLRNGVIIEIPSSDIVVGDIVFLFSGEKIQADGIIIEGDIRVDQSALNGESRDVKKYCDSSSGEWSLENCGRVYRGSVIISGEAKMKVGRVGKDSYYGMVARDVQAQTRESPLKLRLSKFASQISKIGYVMAGVVGFAYLFNTFIADNGFIIDKILASFKDIPFLLSTLIHALTLMITVIVVAAPEGLPMMITVVLSLNMKKMVKDNVLIKKLVGIETAGSMNILFTDKTGTLTTGKLEVDKIVSLDMSANSISKIKKYPKIYEYILLNAIYNTESYISANEVVGGNSTDRAVSGYFKGERVEKHKVKQKLPFTSEKKYSSATLENGITLIKGAPEIILKRARYSLSISGEAIPIDTEALTEKYIGFATHGNRVIAMGYIDSGGELVFVAFVVLKDKIRRGVSEAVNGVKTAGVQVVMLTGDGKETASAIARECGILSQSKNELVLTSSELSELSDEEVKEILPRLRVLSRALPQDKTRLVKLSQELELVVGMTGDGINDAPSLRLADVGFAMGSGTDVAKGAGDVIILDNSFFAINRTILYGRTIFKSIRKFITFQLIMNLVACGVSLVGQFLGIDSPITIIQMLWINIIMDTLGGLAFAGEPPLEYYMKEKPKRRDEPILTRQMISHIAFTGAYTLIMCICFLRHGFFKTLFRSGDEYFMTAFYALFIFAGIFNCFGARCERMWILSNITKNKPFTFIMLLISVIQIVMIYFGGAVFRTVPLSYSEVIYVVLIAFTVVPFEFIRRIFYKLSHHRE